MSSRFPGLKMSFLTHLCRFQELDKLDRHDKLWTEVQRLLLFLVLSQLFHLVLPWSCGIVNISEENSGVQLRFNLTCNSLKFVRTMIILWDTF